MVPKDDFRIIRTIVFLILVGGAIGGWIFVMKKKEDELLKNLEGKMVYFYSKTCFHCVNVENFFKNSKIEEKVQFEKKEVSQDPQNAKLLILLAKKRCKFKEKEIGVPLFWTGTKCVMGDQPIIDYFRETIL